MSPAPSRIQITIMDPDPNTKTQQIKVEGDIDRDTIEEFKTKINEFLPTFTQQLIILDLGNLEFLNSEGIGFLSDIYNQLTTQGKQISILNATPHVMDIIQLVGLNQIIPCVTTPEEAYQLVQN